MKHLLTIDVEAAFRGMASEENGTATDPLLPGAMDRFLDLLDETRASATFFVLGQDVDALRSVLRRCAAAGHEVACHGMRHRRVDGMSPDEFRADLHSAVRTIEDHIQVPCHGYRAPWFSAPAKATWYTDALAAEGIRYDASQRLPLEDRWAGKTRDGLILAPVPLLKYGTTRIGVLGGLALRLLPRLHILQLIHRCEAVAQPACLYLHPYEWYSHDRRCFRTPGTTQAAPARGTPATRWMSAMRRGAFTGRTLPGVRWLTGRVELTAIAAWLGELPHV